MTSPRSKVLTLLLILLFISFLIAALLWPRTGRWLTGTSILIGVCTAILLTVQPDWKRYKANSITRTEFNRHLGIELTGLLLSMGAAILAAGWAGRMAGQAAFAAGGQVWLAMLAGMLAGFAAGFTAGGLVRFIWKRLTSRRRASAGASQEHGAAG